MRPLGSAFRKWHRWIGWAAAIFFVLVSVTGVILQFQQFFGAEEAQKEQLRDLTSTYTVASPLGDLQSRIARAQTAVVAVTGNAPLDRIEMQLKGPHPTITFITGGAQALKFVVSADTGAIEERASGEDESFLLRLHTGEVFGDGGVVLGMLWGVAFLVMTLTGVWVYWNMRRPGRQGLKRIFWMLPLALLIGHSRGVRAGSPFLTDDPGFVPKGWEFKYAGAVEDNRFANVITAPVLDINYTVREHLKWNLTLAGKRLTPTGGHSEYGLADTDFKFKWRFRDESPGGVAISVAPDVTLPTASRDRGLGDGAWRFKIPFQFGKSFGKLNTFAEAGYQWAFDSSASDQLLYGLGGAYAFSDHLTAGAELFGSAPAQNTSEYSLLANVGVIWTFNPRWQLQGSFGRTLRDLERGGPKFLGQVFVQRNVD